MLGISTGLVKEPRISNGWGLFYRNDHCVKPNKPTISTIWGRFIEPIYGDLADGLWHWVYHINLPGRLEFVTGGELQKQL